MENLSNNSLAVTEPRSEIDAMIPEVDAIEQQNVASDSLDMQNPAPQNGSNVADSTVRQTESSCESAGIPGRNNDRKLFVGGLDGKTTEADLNTYFSGFGEIESMKIVMDPLTGRSKGFAFIVFKSFDGITKIMASAPHTINNKVVDPQIPKQKLGKIYVSGTSNLNKTNIEEYFKKFGCVVDVQIPFDKVAQNNKDYCFVLFESEVLAKNVLKYKQGRHLINGVVVYVKPPTTPSSQPTLSPPFVNNTNQQQMYGRPSWNPGHNRYEEVYHHPGVFPPMMGAYNRYPIYPSYDLSQNSGHHCVTPPPPPPEMPNRRGRGRGRGNNKPRANRGRGYHGAPEAGNFGSNRFHPY